MIRLLALMIRLLVFSLVVIVLSNAVHWHGRTISDQVRIGIAHAERAPWAEDVQDRAQSEWRGWVDWARGQWGHLWGGHARPHTSRDEAHEASARENSFQGKPERLAAETPEESLPASERQKLKALIRELNGSHGRD